MSETETAETTSDVAADVYDSMESAESTPAETSTEAAPVETAAPVEAKPEMPAPAIVEPPLTEEEKLLHEFGFKDKRRDDGREFRIPRSKVQQMIASGLKRGQEKWTSEKATIEQQTNAYKADLDEMYADLKGEPKAFLEKLSQHDPRYKVFLEPSAAPVAQTPAAPLAAMPDPDVQLPDGSRTYSIDGLKTLLEWNTANVESRLMPKLDERLKPFAERENAAKEREQSEKAVTAVRERTSKMIADAQNWPGFKDHESDILKALQADSEQARVEKRRPTLTLEAAYRQAVIPKLSTDRNAMREELLKEINSTAAKTPTASRGGAEHVSKPGPVDTRTVAARIIEQAGG